MADLITLYALERVLFHLSEDQQARQPRYVTGSFYHSRAAARIIIKRELARTKQSCAGLWQAAKDAKEE